MVATLWRVEDAAAGALAEQFYRYCSATDPADALALAQRHLMRDPRYAAPFYWAADEMSGGGSPRSTPMPAAQSVEQRLTRRFRLRSESAAPARRSAFP